MPFPFSSFAAPVQSSAVDTFIDNIKLLYAAIVSGSREDTNAAFETLVKSYSHAPENLGQYLANIFEIIEDRLYSNLKIQPEKTYEVLPDMKDFETIHSVSASFLENVINMIPNAGVPAKDMVIEKIINFVLENFSENISLQDAADVVFFNSSYCSRFFKEQTGENFSDYLLRVRMEHAVKLLLKNKKITEISQECGYRSSGYFTKIFKDYFGCTPSEYLRNR